MTRIVHVFFTHATESRSQAFATLFLLSHLGREVSVTSALNVCQTNITLPFLFYVHNTHHRAYDACARTIVCKLPATRFK